MASTKERAWLAAHQKGSKALVAKLDKAHAKNPEYQAFKQKHGLGDTSSVKQVSKSQVDAKKEKARQVLAGKAYGATKGTRMGSAEGTGETLRDTVAPLTRDQHSAVKAAEREAKAAEKPAKPVKAPKPKKETAAAPAPEKKKPTALELIAAAAAKRKINAPPVSTKALRRIAAVGDMEHDHGGFEDLGDTQYGGRRSYSEEVELDEGDKHSFIGKIKRRNELRNKVQSTWKQLGDAQRAGNSSAASKAFRNHERYANLDNPGTWTKVKEEVELDESHKVGDLVSYFHKGLGDHLYGKVQSVEDDHITMKSAGKTWKVPMQLVHKADEKKVPKYRYESVEHVDESKHTSTIGAMSAAAYMPKVDDKVLVRIGGGYGHVRGKVVKVTDSHVSFIHSESGKRYKTPISNVIKEEVEQIDEGMLDDYIEGKIAKHHANKHNPEINAAHAAAAEVTKKMKPFDKKIAQIKKRVSYKDKTHKNYAKTKADLKDAAAAIKPMSDERSKHYDTIRDARKKREADTDSDVETYHKWGVVGLGVKKLKQKLTKEQAEQIDEASDLHCPSCGTNHGKDRENPKDKTCSSCGHKFKNIHGYSSETDNDPEAAAWLKRFNAKNPVKEEAKQLDHEGANARRVAAMPKGSVLGSKDDIKTHLAYLNARHAHLKKFGYDTKQVSDKIGRVNHLLTQKEEVEQTVSEGRKKYYQGGAAFADTAAKLQGAINKHKERMNQIENGPEDTYHHAGLNLTTKSRVKLPAPWAKVEDK